MANLGGPPDIPGFLHLQQPEAETFRGKFSRKMQENPFVPIGCLATACALTYGLIAFRQGKTRVSQLSMRARILAQGFTVVAILGGVVTAAMKPRP